MRYVIIGNSAAGIGAVEGIRQVDNQVEVTVISSEPYHTYSRPAISYLLMGRTTEEKMKYRDDDFYDKMRCKILCGKTVTEVRPAAKQVVLDEGSVISYDKLLVATGSEPFVPSFDGLDMVSQKFTFMSLDDARKLGAALRKDKQVLIVGAGLIGLKCAEGILDKVRSVTVLDLAPRILSSILVEDGAQLVQCHLESKGIDFRLSTGVKYFDSNRAMLVNGEMVGFDLLVLATGVRPNTALLASIVDIDKGIVINKKSETSAKDIYAAGDCTQTLDISSGENRIMPLLPGAYMQGECAGVNMADGNMSFDKAIPMNAIGFFGKHIITAGNYSGEVYTENVKDRYKRLFYSDNKLNGYILIGNVEKAGIYTSLIRERTPLDSIDFSLICEKPGLMAFTKEERNQKLGSVSL
ncbi:MAG: FAD-dependent oxidoreductase [Eubacteriales bacterium]|nr:FAD-dependent oxidoreductase [Eubacteriales bacterium]